MLQVAMCVLVFGLALRWPMSSFDQDASVEQQHCILIDV